MSLATFRKALRFAQDFDCHTEGTITLGGGEPTLHRHFEVILLETMAVAKSVHVITNGKIRRRALLLFGLAEKGRIEAELSVDEFHESIDHETVELFEKIGAIRDITKGGTRYPIAVGRAQEIFGDDEPDKDCCCDGWIVKPSGKIVQCGCPDSPVIGDVKNGIKIENHCMYDCYRSSEFQESLKEVA